jgi:hypothetical protein
MILAVDDRTHPAHRSSAGLVPAASVLGRCHGPASCASVDDRRCPQVRAAPPRPRSLGPKDYWRTTAGPRLTTGRAPAACQETSQRRSKRARSSRSPAESRPGARCAVLRSPAPPPADLERLVPWSDPPVLRRLLGRCLLLTGDVGTDGGSVPVALLWPLPHNRPPPAAAGREGWAAGPSRQGRVSSLPATRCSRHSRPAAGRRRS